MSLKELMALIAVCLILLIPTALGSPQVIPIWHFNVSLDFGGKNITTEPEVVKSDLDSTTRGIIIRGDTQDDWGAIYLMTQREKISVVLEDKLRRLLMPSMKAIKVYPGTIAETSGIIASGDARVEHGFGQRCYGGAAVLSPLGMGQSITFMMIAHFKDESLNEHLIKTVRVDYVPPENTFEG